MEIRAFTEALSRTRSQEELRELAPGGLLKYLEQQTPDAATLRSIVDRISKIDSDEGKAIQELFDRRFALDGLHPEVRGGLIKAATKLGISDHKDLAYRLQPVLNLVATANEAIAIANSGKKLTRKEVESVAKAGEDLKLTAVDFIALLTQAGTKSKEDLDAMARTMASPEASARK